MALYSSYVSSSNKLPEKMIQGLPSSDRNPLSVINGNFKSQRDKDSFAITLSRLERSLFLDKKDHTNLPFSIFHDDEPNNIKVENDENSIEVPVLRSQSFIFPTVGSSDNENSIGLFSFPPLELPPEEVNKEDPEDYLGHGFPYKEDNFAHLRRLELKYRPHSRYLKFQEDINPSMRSILIDWMVDVGLELKFSSACIHLAVSLIDRFMSCQRVSKEKLQLVGVASLFISAKYEEVDSKKLEDYFWITNGSYTKKEILKMEQVFMYRLGFYVGAPTALSFLHLVCCMFEVPQEVLFYGQYLCELALLDYEPFVSFLPSRIGVASYCLARYVFRHTMWIDELETTGFSFESVKPVINSLYVKVRSVKAQTLKSIPRKYRHPDFMKVAEVQPPELLIML